MFGIKKLQKKIDELENDVYRLREDERINNLRVMFLLNNKPKYKVGDKVGKDIVIEVLLIPKRDYSYYGNYISDFEWDYKFLDKKAKPTEVNINPK